eukprot:Rmarinus@m.16072
MDVPHCFTAAANTATKPIQAIVVSKSIFHNSQNRPLRATICLDAPCSHPCRGNLELEDEWVACNNRLGLQEEILIHNAKVEACDKESAAHCNLKFVLNKNTAQGSLEILGSPGCTIDYLRAKEMFVALTQNSSNRVVGPPLKRRNVSTDYAYRKLLDVQLFTKVNLYGVITDYRDPYKSRGQDYTCSIDIRDESVTEPMKINIFRSEARELPRPRAVGDIIRVHRLDIGRYHDKPQGKIAKTDTITHWVLFSGSGSDAEPYARSSVKFTLNDADRRRTSELRSWCSSHLSTQRLTVGTDTRRFAINDLTPATDQFIDLLCYVWKSASTQSGQFLVVADGTYNPSMPDSPLCSSYGAGYAIAVKYGGGMHAPPSSLEGKVVVLKGARVMLEEATNGCESDRAWYLLLDDRSTVLVLPRWHVDAENMQDAAEKCQEAIAQAPPPLPPAPANQPHQGPHPQHPLEPGHGRAIDAHVHSREEGGVANGICTSTDGHSDSDSDSDSDFHGDAATLKTELDSDCHEYPQVECLADAALYLDDSPRGLYCCKGRVERLRPSSISSACVPRCMCGRLMMCIAPPPSTNLPPETQESFVEVNSHDRQFFECPHCDILYDSFRPELSSGISWEFSLQMDIVDRSKRVHDVKLEGKHAETFFGLEPKDLSLDYTTRTQVKAICQGLKRAGSLPFCLKRTALKSGKNEKISETTHIVKTRVKLPGSTPDGSESDSAVFESGVVAPDVASVSASGGSSDDGVDMVNAVIADDFIVSQEGHVGNPSEAQAVV